VVGEGILGGCFLCGRSCSSGPAPALPCADPCLPRHPDAVGALCELTHFVTVPERRRLFINARVVGRFQTQHIVNDKPFLAGVCPAASAGAGSGAAVLGQH
jgi:hypothetical protein